MVALAGKAAVSPAPATPATLVDDSGRRVAGCLPADLNAPLADVTDDKRAEPDEIRLLVRRRRRRYDLRPHLLARVESSGPLVAVLDLPLDRVREVIQARDPDLTRQILAEHEIRMQARLEETARIVAELQSGVAPVTHTPVHVRYEDPVDTVSVSGNVTEAQMPCFILDSLQRLLEFVSRHVPQASAATS